MINIQVKIVKTFPQTEKLKVIVNLTIDDSFAVHGIKILDSGKGLFVAMPNIKNGEKRKDIYLQQICCKRCRWKTQFTFR